MPVWGWWVERCFYILNPKFGWNDSNWIFFQVETSHQPASFFQVFGDDIFNHSPPILSNAEPVEIAFWGSLRWTWMTTVWWGTPQLTPKNALKTHLFCGSKGLPESKKRNGEKQPLCILDTFLDPETETSISEFGKLHGCFPIGWFPTNSTSYLRLLFD